MSDKFNAFVSVLGYTGTEFFLAMQGTEDSGMPTFIRF